MSASSYRFTLLRHGQSVANAENRHQGQRDYPLTPHGEEQISRLARRWLAEKRSFDGILASPLSRARQSAEIIAAALHLPIEFDAIWMERDDGLISGLLDAEAELQFPNARQIASYAPRGETGESRWDVYLRAGQALQRLIERPAGSWLVVSHGGLLNALICAALGIPPLTVASGARFALGNAAFGVLQYKPHEHVWRLLSLNDQNHLLEEEPR
ncbi:MAG: histidine phosphatase family protein [Chloroflexi bacterium]|nr:histidine phosphatase family protein [Chloroflexota bacterium]